MKFNTIKELLDYTEKIKGKSINDVVESDNVFQGRTNLNQRKGFLGNLVETEFYHYPINSNPEADFNKLGVELKTSDNIGLANDTIDLYNKFNLKIFGGCCGTDNTHIEEMAKRLKYITKE